MSVFANDVEWPSALVCTGPEICGHVVVCQVVESNSVVVQLGSTRT